jgi:hypothetical protein
MKLTRSTMLRWPPDLRQAVADAAGRNRRSMNSEILARLEASFSSGIEITHGHLLPCPCGAGRPDETWRGNKDSAAFDVSCDCGRAVTDSTEAGAALKWNALVRGRAVA